MIRKLDNLITEDEFVYSNKTQQLSKVVTHSKLIHRLCSCVANLESFNNKKNLFSDLRFAYNVNKLQQIHNQLEVSS
jgi:hypothetical protein